MARLDLISQALLFGKLEADHRGREWKAVLQTCLNLFAERGSPGQSSGPRDGRNRSTSSKGPQIACSSASFLTPPLGDPGLNITEEEAGQAAGLRGGKYSGSSI